MNSISARRGSITSDEFDFIEFGSLLQILLLSFAFEKSLLSIIYKKIKIIIKYLKGKNRINMKRIEKRRK